MQYIEVGTAAYRKTLLSMLLGSLVTFAILYSPQPLISEFSRQYQVSPSTASFTISFATGALAITMLFVSLISNAWGRKGIMSISLFATSVLAILSAFCSDFHLLLWVRLFEGVSLAGFPAIAMTYLNEEIAPRSIGGVMGVYVAGTAVGGFAGRMIVSALTDYFSWHLALLVLGIFSMVCSVLFWKMLPESNHFRPVSITLKHWASGFRRGLGARSLLSLYGIGFLLLGAYATLFNYIAYPLTQAPYNLSQTVIGFLFILQLIGSWSSVLFGKWADRVSRTNLIVAGVILLFFGAVLTLNPLLLVKIIGLTLFACGFFAGHTVASGWVGRVAPPGDKAYASSLYLLFYYTGSSVVGWAGGLFLSRFGWTGIISMICGVLLLTVLLSMQIVRSSHVPERA